MDLMIDGMVSIIIPTYKGHSTLPRAIHSVLTQSYDKFEIIVVDDNDPESESRLLTEKVIQGFSDKRIKYIRHKKNSNGAVARNTGLKNSRGEFIAFLDDDDIYLKDRLSKSVELLQQHTEAGMFFCDVLHIYGEWYGCIHGANKEWLTPRGVLLHGDAVGSGSNLFLRRNVIEEINGFDEDFLRHQDLEFSIRALSYASPVILNEILVVKCYNETNNVPNFEKFYSIKMQYTDKFEELICDLEEQDRNQYYADCFNNLYKSALMSGNKKNVKATVLYGRAHGLKRNFKQHIQSVFYGLKMNRLFMFKKRDVSKERNSFSNIYDLSSERFDEINEKLINFKL